MEIKLTEKQLQIIGNIFQTKQFIEQEYKKIIERETEFIVNLCEAKGVEAVQGIEFKDGLMIVPVTTPEKELKIKKK